MARDTSTPGTKDIVIIGGGVIGILTAYFLTRHPSFSPEHHRITILEASGIASGASGKAGGLLATWAYPKCIVSLSFKLHKELAKEHGGAERWGYRAVEAGMVRARIEPTKKLENGEAPEVRTGQEQEAEREQKQDDEQWQGLPKVKRQKLDVDAEEEAEEEKYIPKELNWLDDDKILSYDIMGSTSQTAQVHPELFTKSIAELAVQAGAKIILGSATTINYTEDGKSVESVSYTEKDTGEARVIPASDVTVSVGPWTRALLPKAPIEPLRAHSVVVKANVTPFAVFTEIELPEAWGTEGKEMDGVVGSERREEHHEQEREDNQAGEKAQAQTQTLPEADKRTKHPREVNPEMYARPDGTVYACGEGDSLIPLPANTSLVEVDPVRCHNLHTYLSLISPTIRNAPILKRQACYLPVVTEEAGPVIGKTRTKGLFVATGHTCWGIQNSCATGKVMSEFVFEGKARSAGVKACDPRLWGL